MHYVIQGQDLEPNFSNIGTGVKKLLQAREKKPVSLARNLNSDPKKL